MGSVRLVTGERGGALHATVYHPTFCGSRFGAGKGEGSPPSWLNINLNVSGIREPRTFPDDAYDSEHAEDWDWTLDEYQAHRCN